MPLEELLKIPSENLLHKVAFSLVRLIKTQDAGMGSNIPVDKHLGKWIVSCLNVEPLKTDTDPQRD